MIRTLFKETKFEVVSPSACWIWSCESEADMNQQLKYVQDELGYTDAFTNVYEQEYSY